MGEYLTPDQVEAVARAASRSGGFSISRFTAHPDGDSGMACGRVSSSI